MEKKVVLTFFGGINKVGGNIVLLEDLSYDVKIFLDFGVNDLEFSKYRNNFPESNKIDQLTNCHVLPREVDVPIKNLYSRYYLFDHLKYKYHQKIRKCEGKYDPPTNLDGILVSHPHRDHYRGVSFVNRNIPIYTGVVTKRIIKANSKCTSLRFDNFLYGLNWKKFRTGNVIQIKKMDIYPVHVDHSIPASYGFIICTSVGIIVYTGDFRMHGPLQFMTVDLIKKVKEICKKGGEIGGKRKVVALICEGTHIHKGSIESERIVKRHLRKLFNTMPFDYVLVNYERIDWDRFRTYVDIAKKFNWKYIISDKDAYYYNRLNKKAIYDSMKDPNIESTENILILSREKRTFAWKKEVDQWLKNTKNEDRRIELHDLKKLERKFFIYINSIRDYDIIKDFLPKGLNGVFISSNVDPYAEDYRINKRQISKDLLDIGAPSYRIHASGHAKPHDIIRFVNEINPEKLIPIHTEHPEFFSKLFKDPKKEVILPAHSVPIEITSL